MADNRVKSKFVGMKFIYKNCEVKIMSLFHGRMTGTTKYWCRCLDGNMPRMVKGEEFTLSLATIKRHLKAQHG